MSSPEQPTELEVIRVFGQQIENGITRYARYRNHPEGMGVSFPPLRGYEHSMLALSLKVATKERPGMGGLYGPYVGQTLYELASDALRKVRWTGSKP